MKPDEPIYMKPDTKYPLGNGFFVRLVEPPEDYMDPVIEFGVTSNGVTGSRYFQATEWTEILDNLWKRS